MSALPAFVAFLKDRGHRCTRAGRNAGHADFFVDVVDVAEAVALMVAFHDEVRLGKKPEHDALLFQVSPGFSGSPADVNITRQLYGGAGHSQQLGLSVRFAALPRLEQGWNLWSFDVADLDEFASIAVGAAVDVARGAAAVRGVVTLDRF